MTYIIQTLMMSIENVVNSSLKFENIVLYMLRHCSIGLVMNLIILESSFHFLVICQLDILHCHEFYPLKLYLDMLVIYIYLIFYGHFKQGIYNFILYYMIVCQDV